MFRLTFMQWLGALRVDADALGFGSRVDAIPQWMLERLYDEGTDASIEHILLYCETEVGRNYLAEQQKELERENNRRRNELFTAIRKPMQSARKAG